MKFIGGCTLLALSTIAAGAQERPYDWAGGYIGASFSQHQLSHDFALPGISFSDTVVEDNKINGGSIFGGYMWALPHGFVAGLELSATFFDADPDDLGFESSTAAYGSRGTTEILPIMTSQVQYAGSLHARLGYAVDRIMIFASAGPSVASARLWGVSFSANKTDPGPDYFSVVDIVDDNSQTLTGIGVAVGAEVGITRHLSGRIRFEYTEWDGYPGLDAKLCYSCPIDKIDVTSSTQQWSVGLSYRF